MQNFFKLAAVAALCSTAVAAHAELSLDANLELDTTYTNAVDAPASNARESDLGMGGRVEFNVGAKASNGDAFVAARASLLLKKDGDTGMDDMWVQFGNAGMDLKLGRFEAYDLFPVGKDTVVEYAGYTPYQANMLRGRKGRDVAHGALGVNAAPGLRFELGLVYSKDEGEARGIRPAVGYTTGPLTLRAGVESVKVVGSDASTENGVGLSVGYALSKDSNINVNFAKKEDDKTIGINAIIGAAGIGLVHGKGATSADKVTTVYAAYSLPLFGVKGATITPAISYSKGGTGTDDQVAVRARINYAF
ncbi:MAG: carbohydrate porin [Hydrogenophaga sp.]|nr:carbohydrate porin [Hydrogenophaga sp.]